MAENGPQGPVGVVSNMNKVFVDSAFLFGGQPCVLSPSNPLRGPVTQSAAEIVTSSVLAHRIETAAHMPANHSVGVEVLAPNQTPVRQGASVDSNSLA